MKYFVFLALLPYIFAAEVHNAVCMDGTQCSQGKYCCESGCCDISKEMQDKGYVPALPPASQLNLTVFITELKTKDSVCYGTQCEDYCMEIVQGGTCCGNPRYGCPRNARCCGDSFSEVPWCCKISQLCGFVKNECLNDGDSCDGTQCGDYCFDNDYMIYDDYDDYNRTCCPNPQYSCPASTICCGNSYSGDPWCCKKSQSCSPIRNLCRNSAVTTSIAMMSILFIFMIRIASKYFL